MSINKDICTNCPYRDRCKKPCIRIKDYIEQDYVGSKEYIDSEGDISEVYTNTVEREWPDLKENTHLTKKEKEILSFLGRGLNRSDVCQLLNITKKTLRNHVYNLRKKLQN